MKKYDTVYVTKGDYYGCYGEVVSITNNIVFVEIEHGFIMVDCNEVEVVYSV